MNLSQPLCAFTLSKSENSIALQLNGVPVGTATVGADGKFNIPFTAPTTPGTYTLLTTYTPTDATAPTASVLTIFTVSASGGGGTTPTNITISFGNGGNGERHLSAALLHAWRLPLAPCMLQLLGNAAFHLRLCQIHILVLLLCACCVDWKMQGSCSSPVRCVCWV